MSLVLCWVDKVLFTEVKMTGSVKDETIKDGLESARGLILCIFSPYLDSLCRRCPGRREYSGVEIPTTALAHPRSVVIHSSQ